MQLISVRSIGKSKAECSYLFLQLNIDKYSSKIVTMNLLLSPFILKLKYSCGTTI